MSKTSEWCCCSPCRIRVDRAAFVYGTVSIVFDIGIFSFILYLFMENDDTNAHFIGFLLTFRGIVDILLCAMVIVGHYRRNADLFLPYLVINALVIILLAIYNIYAIFIIIQGNHEQSNFNILAAAGYNIITVLCLILDIAFFVVIYRAYKFMLRAQQIQPQHPPTQPAVVVFSTPTNPPPTYNPSFLQEELNSESTAANKIIC